MKSLPKIKNLESERLILRKISLKDSENLFEYAQLPTVARYVFWDAHSTLKESKQFIKQLLKDYKINNKLMWAVQIKNQPKIIGTCGFMSYYKTIKALEVGYAFNPKYGHKGYAQEALKTIINYAFTNMDIIRIEGICVEENQPSAKVMLNCNMQFEGILHDAFIKHQEIKNCKVFAITKRNWQKLLTKNN